MSSLVRVAKDLRAFLLSTVLGASIGEVAESVFNLEAICSADSNKSSLNWPVL